MRTAILVGAFVVAIAINSNFEVSKSLGILILVFAAICVIADIMEFMIAIEK